MKDKLKIAYIGQKGIENIVGGIETHVRELAFKAAKAGYEVIVYARPYTIKSKAKYLNGVLVKRLPTLPTKHLDTISHVFLATWHAIFSKADIFHYHGVGPSLLSFIPRIFRPGSLVVVTFHSIDREHTKWGWFARKILRMGERTACSFPHITITVSKELVSYCWQNYKKKAILVPNGISGPYYTKADLIKNKFGLEKDSYILVLSRLVPHKKIHLIIEAFKKIKSDLNLVIAGEGAYTDHYVNFLKELSKNNPRIIFTGPCQGKALRELLSNCLFLVSASDSEGCPTTAIEAMSYGKVVLVADLKVNREIVGKFGYYFRKRKADDLRKKIEWLISRKGELSKKKKMIAEYVLSNYHWDSLAPRIFNIYKNFYNHTQRWEENPSYLRYRV